MSVGEVINSKGFGDWSRWLLAYVISLTVASFGFIWFLSGYSHDLANELASIHADAKNADHKLDLVLGIPGETPGLLPPLIAQIGAISEEQKRVKDHLIIEDHQREELGTKLQTVIDQTGTHNPILNRIEKQLNAPLERRPE